MDTSLAKTRYDLLQAVNREIQGLEDSIRESKYRRNALVPISRLPPEILSLIFSLLSFSAAHNKSDRHVSSLLRLTHVCRLWRDTALNRPHLWSHINFTKLTRVGITEMLARAKMAPLHLEARIDYKNKTQLDFFEQQLEAHISHTRQLSLSEQFQTVLERFISSAPAMEFLSLADLYSSHSHRPIHVIPATFLNNTASKLAGLELCRCNISWKSPLLKGLRSLEIWDPSKKARPPLEDWLDALDEMPQLEALILHNASPICSTAIISEPQRTITLPSLTQFEITAYVLDCVLALAHLVLPALTSLRVDIARVDRRGNGISLLIPHVIRNAHGLQDTAPLQRIVSQGGKCQVKILACTIPDLDIDDCIQISRCRAPRMAFHAWGDRWHDETHTAILDAVLTHLPTDAISTLSMEDPTRVSKEFLLRHISSLVMLERVYLDSTSFRAFRDMLTEDPPIGARLPRLRKLVLRRVSLTALRTYRLRDMLQKRVEQGVPLETLNLRTCTAAHRAIELLATTVGDVQGPAKLLTPPSGDPAFFHWKGGVEFFNEKEKLTEDDEYDNAHGPRSRYGSTNSTEDDSDDDTESFSDE